MISTSMWTRPEIEQHLRDLGLQASETLIVHSSLKSIGWVVGGARTVVDALFAVLGPEGTLVMPAQSGENSDPANWSAPPVPRAWWPHIREHTPAFDPAITPLRRMGAIAACFRNYPGVLRSYHPLDSFIAYGPNAAVILSKQPLEAGLGDRSPTQKLVDVDAHVLLLGVDAMALYRDTSEERQLESLVIRYHHNLVIASPDDSCRLEPILSTTSHPSIQCISGRASLLEQLYPHLPEFEFRRMFLMTVDRASLKRADARMDPDEVLAAPVLATIDDVPEIADFFTLIHEFHGAEAREDRIAELSTAMQQGSCHYYLQRHDGKIIATAGTTAENSQSAMIVGVATHPDFRGRGLASRLISELCDKLLGSRFESLALFYDNPDAGRIYRRIGFLDTGDWMMAEHLKGPIERQEGHVLQL